MAEASGFKPVDLAQIFRIMRTSRRLDDREILLKRQDKIFFQISGAGHEAIGAAAGLVMRPGYDWFFLYYRDRALALSLGITAEEMLLGSVGAASDPASGGRQMPSHFADPAKNIALVSSCTGTQYLHALGCADALRHLYPGEDRIVLVSSGEGATSEGEFWECINQACLHNSPLLFLVMNKHSLGACVASAKLDPRAIIDAQIDLVLHGLQAPPRARAAKQAKGGKR